MRVDLPSNGSISARVDITILSNWGHQSCVGLTEIQLFGLDRCRFPVSEDDVTIRGAGHADDNDIMVLFNSKFKVGFLIILSINRHNSNCIVSFDLNFSLFQTVKERNMWTCAYYDGIDPITLSIVVHPAESTDSIPISKIRIWNYNKTLTVCVGPYY